MGKKAEGGGLVTCPECAKQLTSKGFGGHMRFKHGVSAGNTKETYDTVKNEATNAGNAGRLFQLIDTLKECRERKERVDEMDESPIFPLLWRDEAATAIRRGLDVQEARIIDELKSLGFVETRENS